MVENGLAEFGTLVVGIICFGFAAFMPYLVYRLLPVVAAAGVAAGVASGPLRAASTGMQFQYYAQSTMGRLAGTSDPESSDRTAKATSRRSPLDIDVGAAAAALGAADRPRGSAAVRPPLRLRRARPG